MSSTVGINAIFRIGGERFTKLRRICYVFDQSIENLLLRMMIELWVSVGELNMIIYNTLKTRLLMCLKMQGRELRKGRRDWVECSLIVRC